MKNIYNHLLERILFGEYPPGMELDEKQIAKELRLSRTPVREAFLRLKAEGLVRIIPRGGIHVSEISIREFKEVTELRLVLEEYWARLAVGHANQERLEQFGKLLHSLKPAWKKLSPKERMKKDLELHLALLEITRNETIRIALEWLIHKATLFWGQVSGEREVLLEGILNDFEEVYKALRQKNVKRCVQALHRHVEDHVKGLLKYLEPERITLSKLELPS